MFQVIIKNFQSIQEAKITVDGITLIKGSTDAGKSACLRALQAACTNRFRTGQVRFGEDHASIVVKVPESEDLLVVQRKYNGGSPLVKLGDKSFTKLARTMPKEVTDFLNLGFFDVGGEQVSCNFHPQFQKPLLLEYSQQRVMELLSASSALDELKIAKDENLAKRSEVKGAIQLVDSIIEKATQEHKEVKESIEAFSEPFSKFEEYYNSYCTKVNIKESIEELKSQREILSALQKRIEHLNSTISILSRLNELESLQLGYANILSNYYALMAIASEIELLKQRLDLLKSLADLSDRKAKLADVALLSKVHEDKCKRIKELKEIVENNICPICGSKVE